MYTTRIDNDSLNALLKAYDLINGMILNNTSFGYGYCVHVLNLYLIGKSLKI